jgi:transposase
VYLFAACRPGTDEAFALALPRATTEAMAVFLAAFAQQLETGVHAVLLLDQAGWHCTPKLAVPDNVTLLPLPACSPELNPVERVWLYLRERFLSHRVHRDYAAVLEAACAAWNRLIQETGRLASLTGYPYLMRSEFRSSSIKPKTENQSKAPAPFPGAWAAFDEMTARALKIYNDTQQDGHLNGKSPNERLGDLIKAKWQAVVLQPGQAGLPRHQAADLAGAHPLQAHHP